MIARAAGVPRPQVDEKRAPTVELAKELKPDPPASPDQLIVHAVPPDPSLILLIDIE